jgi:SAM-dependent methyltransferase
VLCTQVLEHVPRPEPFFEELVRVLRPNGCLIVTVPFSYRVHSAPFDYHRFTHFALEGLAGRARLDIEVLLPRGGFWTVIGQKLSSHLVSSIGRMGRPIQRLGGYGHEEEIADAPRWWALPLIAPAVVASTAVTRLLERIDPDPSDTLGYLMVARKKGAEA